MSRVNVEERLRGLREQALRREVRPDAWPRLQRRLRRQPWRRAALVAGLALAVLVASVVPGLLAGRAKQPPVPALGNLVPKGWREYRDERENYRFRYPPGWVVKPNGLFQGQALILPPESAAVPLPVKNDTQLPFFMTAANGWSYYAASGAGYPIAGRLPGGQAFLQTNAPDRPGRNFSRYVIDWGRSCSRDPHPDPGTPATDCGAHTQHVTIDGETALWDRYHAIATTIVRSMAPLRATLPSQRVGASTSTTTATVPRPGRSWEASATSAMVPPATSGSRSRRPSSSPTAPHCGYWERQPRPASRATCPRTVRDHSAGPSPTSEYPTAAPCTGSSAGRTGVGSRSARPASASPLPGAPAPSPRRRMATATAGTSARPHPGGSSLCCEPTSHTRSKVGGSASRPRPGQRSVGDYLRGGGRGRTPPPPGYRPTGPPEPPWCRWGTDARLSTGGISYW